jgi:lantibiotic modifying enzyme
MLYEADRHESLSPTPWNERTARSCITAIINEAVDRYSPEMLWPSHPEETFSPDAHWNLYVGAAGTIWALAHLASKTGSITDLAAIVPALLEPNRVWLERDHANDPFSTYGLLTGDTGILLVQARLGDLGSATRRIGSIVDANRDNPAREFMWGSPGTMLASLWLYERTGDGHWAERFRRDAEILWTKLEFSDEAGCFLWTQHLYGHEAVHIGAVHGFAGNAFAVIRGWPLLSPGSQARWAELCAQSLRHTARYEDGCANWPQSIGKHRPGRTAMLVQHCHGAPGIVNCFAGLPDSSIDDLLLAAGETTWRAGPLKKGAGLCHGTSGNGYAFLKLFRRTGDTSWLDRARRYAMHAIEQHESAASVFGQRRYTLWTGDLGLAVYLWNCIEATDCFPTLDNLFPEGTEATTAAP